MDHRVLRFLGQNDDLPVCPEGVHLSFELIAGRIELHATIDENTTVDAIRRAWATITEWRRRLLDYQGRWLRGGENEFYERLWQAKQAGRSYRQLADGLNRQVEHLVQEQFAWQQEFEAARPGFVTWGDYDHWQFGRADDGQPHSQHNPFSGEQALDVIQLCGIREDDACLRLRDALDNPQHGRSAFLPGEPIGPEMVRERLRYWGQVRKPPPGWHPP